MNADGRIKRLTGAHRHDVRVGGGRAGGAKIGRVAEPPLHQVHAPGRQQRNVGVEPHGGAIGYQSWVDRKVYLNIRIEEGRAWKDQQIRVGIGGQAYRLRDAGLHKR